jgi:hypothetical protein
LPIINLILRQGSDTDIINRREIYLLFIRFVFIGAIIELKSSILIPNKLINSIKSIGLVQQWYHWVCSEDRKWINFSHLLFYVIVRVLTKVYWRCPLAVVYFEVNIVFIEIGHVKLLFTIRKSKLILFFHFLNNFIVSILQDDFIIMLKSFGFIKFTIPVSRFFFFVKLLLFNFFWIYIIDEIG